MVKRGEYYRKRSIPLHDLDTAHSHEHVHNHGGKLTISLFFVGLVAFLAGFILEGSSSFYSSMAFILSVVTAGYHIILEGVGDEVYGSTINGSGTFTMKVPQDSSKTVFLKILQLVKQSQESLTKTATLIQRLEPKYVTIVLALFPFMLLAGPYILDWSWEVSLYRSMFYLISVSPCACCKCCPTTLATISNLSKKGVLVKGGAYLSKLHDLKAISFDNWKYTREPFLKKTLQTESRSVFYYPFGK